jgi:hypothetical protein
VQTGQKQEQPTTAEHKRKQLKINIITSRESGKKKRGGKKNRPPKAAEKKEK